MDEDVVSFSDIILCVLDVVSLIVCLSPVSVFFVATGFKRDKR